MAILVRTNFHLAAFTYLYEWVCYDRYFTRVLAITASTEPEPAEACEQLFVMAKHYNILRNFKVEEAGIPRLLPLWNALKKMERPSSPESAKERVGQFVAELRPTYSQDLWSAASKILWMRFGSPVVIYDSVARDWLYSKGACNKSASYSIFYDAWQNKFAEQEAEIRSVCEGLKQLSISRRFFGLDGLRQEEFEEAVSSPSFAERVFDHALLNAGTLES